MWERTRDFRVALDLGDTYAGVLKFNICILITCTYLTNTSSGKEASGFWTFVQVKGAEPERGAESPSSGFLGANNKISNTTLLISNYFLKGLARFTKHKENLKICLEKDPLVISFNKHTLHRKLFFAQVHSSMQWKWFLWYWLKHCLWVISNTIFKGIYQSPNRTFDLQTNLSTFSSKNKIRMCIIFLFNTAFKPSAWMEGSLGKNGHMYMYDWVPLLSTWNNLNTVNQLYSNTN